MLPPSTRLLPLPSSWLPLLLLLAHQSRAEEQEGPERPTVAVLGLQQGPSGLQGHHPAYLAAFSGWTAPEGDLVLLAPSEEHGCSPYTTEEAAEAEGAVAVVLRGNCTFVHKAEMAQQAGAKGVIIVSDSQTVQIMGRDNVSEETAAAAPEIEIFVLGVDKAFGEKLRNATLKADKASSGPLAMSVSAYTSSMLNISELFLICMGTALVALGAWFATADLDVHPKESMTAALAAPQEEVAEIDQYLALGFFVVGSCFLVILFFFMQYLIYVVIFGFCVGGLNTITQFGAVFLVHWCPALKNTACNVSRLGCSARHADLIAAIPAIAVVASWLVMRNTPNGWPFQDIIGAGFLCSLQRTLRLPNMKVATILLSAMFFFDIFWVFISPIFFHESVMVSVATGGGTGESVPMLLRLPALGDPLGSDRLLGFGDIALPGLLVSYLLRHDLLSRRTLKDGYFLPVLVGYFVGLNCTIAALCIMKMGQPALLYLVPCTLGTTLLLSKARGELGLLWQGMPAEGRGSSKEDGGV